MIVVYDCNDNVITVIEDAQSINAFINGYMTFKDYDHYETI